MGRSFKRIKLKHFLLVFSFLFHTFFEIPQQQNFCCLSKMFRKFFRKFYMKIALCSTFSIATLVLVIYFGFIYRSVEYRFFDENYLSIGDGHSSGAGGISGGSMMKHGKGDQNCHLPVNISPFDSSILSFLETLPKRVECGGAGGGGGASGAFRPLTFIDEKSGDDDESWAILRQNHTSYACHYQLISKPAKDDSNFDFGPKTLLHPIDGLELRSKENYVYIECAENGWKNYENIHFWFNPKSSGTSSKNEKKPSVLILVIESLSQINYRRYLNRTREVFERGSPNVFYLDGLNKLADNSFPNMVPLLTGKRLYNGELDNENYGPYDEWPFIWKRFSAEGYQTALIEDYPRFTLFNYESKGFVRDTPTDFYPRPYWLKLFQDYSPLMLKYLPFHIDPCYKDRVPKVDIFFDQLYHFVRRSHQRQLPLFAFAFYIELTHNNFNKAQTIDSHVAEFLERVQPLLLAKDTILILMGDHGNRFGPILQTTIGRIEERMPLFGMSLPDSLVEDHPHLVNNLRENRHRLTTWLDIHQMLNDILDANYSDHRSVGGGAQRSVYSPWRETIPLDRNCRTAFIPDLYCVCDRRLVLDHNSSLLASSASDALVRQLNQMLTPLANLCRTLSLNRTLMAELIFPSDSTAKAQGFKQRIEITVSVAPSQAIFRSRLFRTAHRPDWMVDNGQISRINEYGNQSACIRQRDLKPFCFCSN